MADMLADMEVDMLVDKMAADMVADKKTNKEMLENRPEDALGTLVKLVRCCKILQNCSNMKI